MTGWNKKPRRPGLQSYWKHVVESLEAIIPIYESGSRRIALFSDGQMREEAVTFAVAKGNLVLDLGSGPGTMSRIISRAGGLPILLDASRRMLRVSTGERVQSTFEHLPFREGAFDAVVAGFAVRDSRDLVSSLNEIRRSLKPRGRFSFCDLGKPKSALKALQLSLYLAVIVPVIGLATGGRPGLGFASLYRTYRLTLDNQSLRVLLKRFFTQVEVRERRLGGSIVVICAGRRAAWGV